MQNRLFQVPGTLEGDEGTLLVSFCIPDTTGWRRLIVGWLDTLTYGRAYNERTGYVKDAQSIGREIFNSMSMCNLETMIAAIESIAVSLENFTPVKVQSCSGCGYGSYAGGTQPPSEPGEEGTSPPTNPGSTIVWTTPEGAPTTPGGQGTQAYYNRKCKAANALHEDVVRFVDALDQYNVIDLSFDATFTLLGFILGQATPFFVLDDVILSVIGALLDIVLFVLDESLDIASLAAALAANEDDLVCALYSTGSSDNASIEYGTVLSDAGQSAANIALATGLLSYDAINYVYFKGSDVFEAKLATYTPPIQCSCDCTNYYEADAIDFSVGTHVWDAVYYPAGNEYRVVVEYCQGTPTLLDTTFNSITGYSDKPGHTDFRLWSTEQVGNPGPGDVYNADSFPTGARYQWKSLVFWSNTDFTMSITVHGEV